MGIIKAVCISDVEGFKSTMWAAPPCAPAGGIEGDAHAGNWHRQVSLLSADKIEAFRARGAQVADGAFGENLVVEGMDFRAMPVGTLLRCGDVLLELTQIGKQCHAHCAIYHQMGDCIMPHEGVFGPGAPRRRDPGGGRAGGGGPPGGPPLPGGGDHPFGQGQPGPAGGQKRPPDRPAAGPGGV